MRIAYWTTDVVNFSLAQELVEAAGGRVDLRFPSEAGQAEECQAVLYDLDYLGAEMRSRVLARLLAGEESRPAAVHAYNLGEEEAVLLRRNGIAVFRRLDSRLVAQLHRALVSAERLKHDNRQRAFAAVPA